MNNSVLSVTADGNQPFDVSIFQNYIATKYSASVVGLSMNADKISDMIDTLKSLYPTISIDKIAINNSSIFYFIEVDGLFLIELDYDITGESYSTNLYADSYKTAAHVYPKLKVYEDSSVGSYLEESAFHLDNNGNIQIRVNVKEKKDIYGASKLYYPYLDTDAMFKKYALSSESILLLVGMPGIGKSKLVSLFELFMFNNPTLFTNNKDSSSDVVFFKVAYIKNESILSKDAFWELLRKNNYNFVFLDDADNVLKPRDTEIHTQEDVDRKRFMSQLLSYTDGTTINNTKFIITTNQTVDNIDRAALRRGRTFDILELQTLSNTEARLIWDIEDFKNYTFDSVFGDKTTVLPAELGAEIQLKRKIDGLEENIGEYILREGVSLLHTYKSNTRNKIGF